LLQISEDETATSLEMKENVEVDSKRATRFRMVEPLPYKDFSATGNALLQMTTLDSRKVTQGLNPRIIIYAAEIRKIRKFSNLLKN